MISSQKLAIDLLISILATCILSTTIISVSTVNWKIDYENSIINRTGLFRQCSNTLCCDIKELDRLITLLALFSIILLVVGTLASFILIGIDMKDRNRCYILVPLTLLGAGIVMTLTLIQILERIYPNGYSALMFLIDIIFTYSLGAISLVHGSMFYF